MCDSAVGTFIAFQQKWAVTLESTIHFYRPSRPGEILAATVIERKSGHTISTFWLKYATMKRNILQMQPLPCTTQSKHNIFYSFCCIYNIIRRL